MKSLLFILVLITFTQCSIEKRLYRPGWHVTWKNKSHHRADIENEKTLSANDENSTFGKNALAKDSLVENILILDTFDVATRLTVEQQKNSHQNVVVHDSPSSISQVTTSVVFSKKDVTFADNPKSKYEDSYPRNWGLLILALGIICLIIAGFCLFLAVSSPLPEAIFFLIGTYIFGLSGIVLFLIGFIISLVILAQNSQLRRKKETERLFGNSSEEQQREENEEREPNEENPQNTTRKQTNPEQTDRSKLKAGIVFASTGALLLGLFLLLKQN